MGSPTQSVRCHFLGTHCPHTDLWVTIRRTGFPALAARSLHWAPFQYQIRRLIIRYRIKSRGREIGSFNYCIALKLDRHIGSIAADVPVKFQIDRTILKKIESRGFKTL